MKKTNIVYILADDMGYGDLSCLNPEAAFKTPYFDKMAEKGLVFTDAHSSSAVCTPSRYSILTGRYNWRSKLKSGVLGGYSTPLIEAGRKTVATLLSENGYKTAAIGKWHLGMDMAVGEQDAGSDSLSERQEVDYTRPINNGPTAFGFDHFFGISASLDMPPYAYIENDRFTGVPGEWTEGKQGKEFFRSGRTAPDFRHEDVLEVLTEKVLERIETWQDEPFFIYFPLTAPHTPILPPAEFQGKSGTNAYGDFVLYCDDIVGRVKNKLAELGLEDDTILIFTSDNGCSPMADYDELATFGHNPSYIYRGAKADIYEGGHRVPLLVQWPNRIQAARRCEETVSLTDFMGTVAEILAVDLPDDMGEDSVSNLPLWLDETGYPEVRSIVQQSIDGSLSYRKGRWKLAMCPGSGGWSWPMPGQETEDMPQFQLFDLETDIREQRNLIDKEQEIAEVMRNELLQIVRNGRSTAGETQRNDGAEIWETVEWMRASI